jgi:hypothetical protein
VAVGQHDTRRQDNALAQDKLRLVLAGESGGQRPLGSLGVVAVDQQEALGVLRLRRAKESPSRCEDGVWRLLRRGGNGATGEDRQALVTFLGQPFLSHGEGRLGSPAAPRQRAAHPLPAWWSQPNGEKGLRREPAAPRPRRRETARPLRPLA